METSRPSYPRALPHRSPDSIAAEAERRQEELQDRLDDLAAQAGHLRRCTYALGLALAGAALVATTLTVLLVQRPEPTEPTQPTTALPTLTATPLPAPAPKPAPPPPSPVAEPASRAAALEAMGGLSAANLYQSYLAIGLLAEAVQHKALTVEGATNTLKIIGSCVALVDAKLAKLDNATLEPDDVDSLRQIKAVTALMRIQTQALETSWSTGKAEHAEAYQRARKATWTGLSKVLGVAGA